MSINTSCLQRKNTEMTKDDEAALQSEARTQVQIRETEVMKKMSIMESFEMYRKFFFGREETTPKKALPSRKVDLENLYSSRGTLKSSWLGHSSLLINIDGKIIITDPVLEKKVTLVGPKSFHKEPPVNVDQLPYVDAVIISHDHYDHLNRYSVKQLADKSNRFIVPLGVGSRLEKWGVKREKIVELNWVDNVGLGNNVVVTATPSQHFSGRGLFDRNSALWASWVIKSSNHSLFFSGDTGYFEGFKEIGRKYGPFDVAFLECGAYNERWSKIHMFPEETVQAFLDLGGTYLQPIHWATFNLSLHSWYEPIERLMNASWNSSVGLSTPEIGEVVNYLEQVPFKFWWLQAMSDTDETIAAQGLIQDLQ